MKAHALRQEEAGLHFAQVGRDGQREFALGKNVLLEGGAGRDLDDGPAVGVEAEHAAFGDNEHILAGLAGAAAAESDMLDLVDELTHSALALDVQAASGDVEAGAGGVCAADDDVSGVGGDVDEATDTGGDVGAGGQPGDVDVALTVDLHEGKEAAVEAAALEIAELVR